MKRAKAWANRVLARGFSSGAPKPFEDIPGPKSLPIIGTLYKYLPFVGEYDMKRLHRAQAAKYAKYGPLVREEIIAGEQIVWVYRPDDIAEIFKADKGHYPQRWSHRALFKYRNDRQHLYNTGGLLPTNGIDWWTLRKEFQKDLSKPQNVLNYMPDIDEIVTCFTNVCANAGTFDIHPSLCRLFLELTCLVAFDFKIKAFSEQQMQPDSMSSELIEASITANNCILPLDNGPRLWRFFDTPMYKRFSKATAYMEKVAVQMVNEKVEKLQRGITDEKKSLLEIYLRNPALDKKDVIGMACDMFLAGIDTMTLSSSFALYHLANNPDTQKKLYEEASRLIVNENDPITADTLKQASYTKAVIKETFRMNPAAIGIGRLLQVDVVLNGYLVRKGTNVVTQNQVACRLPENFTNPDDFIPERWLRESDKSEKCFHPYLVLPFGHGSRSCIARRLAEQNLQIFLLRISRNLEFSWEGETLDVISTPINKPDGPVKLKFNRRVCLK